MNTQNILTDLPEFGKLYKNKQAFFAYDQQKPVVNFPEDKWNYEAIGIGNNFIFLGFDTKNYELRLFNISRNKIVWAIILSASISATTEVRTVEDVRNHLLINFDLLS